MTRLTTLSPQDQRWRAFAALGANSPVQMPQWLDVLTNAYGLSAQIIALVDGEEEILAAIPAIASRLPWRRRWTSLPFTDTLEPVALTTADREELLGATAERADTQPLLIRTHTPLPGWFSRQVGTVQIVDLSDGAEAVLRSAKRKTRQNIRLAEKAGLVARPINCRREFLGASLQLMAASRRRLGAPTQPRRYWSQIWELHVQGRALSIGVYLGERLLANGVFLVAGRHAVFKYSASDSATWKLRTNYLMLATALEHLAASGMQSMDFGITDVHNRSLREYKARWGGEELQAHFSATDPRLLPGTLEPGRALTRTIQHLPVGVGRAIGSLAYPFAA